MSRIGKKPVVLPAGVKVETTNGVLTVTGKKGQLARPIPGKLSVEVKEGTATVVLLDKDAGNLYGMYRTILANMVEGVTDGFIRTLEIVGVGYKAESKGGALHLALGYSHPVVFPLPPGVTALVEANTVIKLSGFDKELLGETAARVRMLRKPDVYKNKGIRYRGERLIKKVGKAAGK
ncbi:MAG: 50S ribosomal protein L6 [Deltaproteobacteria bacterium]|uniref:50S ribosomal protein L6 n=1 Tax=Candidatus Deferrimicrobium sp. TaxID=3060586 RepID=UPI002715EBB5|nr:50S ribosomal protein L6 [Candidatus Deferrimicrobium sp.]MCR4310061.1 50S ribosomal protein L6 [Deltaproteobacteria bacterium]MDO8738602.1 50S ribosomal protein L6 [Candidatus Deferrimicrobium sp.]